MQKRPFTARNLGFVAANLLLWAAFHFLFLYFQWNRHLFKLDLFFMILPPVGALFLNWYWLRNEHPDFLMKWVLSWVAIDLAVFILIVLLLSDQLNKALGMLHFD